MIKEIIEKSTENEEDKRFQHIFFTGCPNLYKKKEKYHFFFVTITNIFMNKAQKTLFINSFCKMQNVYLALNRFVYIYKYKKAPILVNSDLSLNPIREKEPNVICIFENNHKYLFKIQELIKIIHNSLGNSSDFFIEPIASKNPYNNICFSKSALYNIYFYIRDNTKLYPEIFFKFFLINFDIHFLKTRYSYLLREFAIEQYIKNSSIETLHDLIVDMIDEHNAKNPRKSFKIHQDFPRKKLVDIMKTYLYFYLQAKYSCIDHIWLYSKLILEIKLICLYEFNPLFGRKKYVRNCLNEKEKYSVVFNESHVCFCKDGNFINSHI
jgi:hypothetical protein